MTSSRARRLLSQLTDAYGSNGALIIPRTDPGTDPSADLPGADLPGAEGADLVPEAALRWPPCECGHSLCPDFVPPEPPEQPA